MTKILFVVLSLLCLLMGCQEEKDYVNNNNETNDVPKYTQSPDDVITSPGDITNLDEFKAFFKNVQQGKADQIRIITHTTEGDPMLHDLEFDGETIKSTRDTRRDTYGAGDVTIASCTSINMKKGEGRTDYMLSGCDKATIDKNVLVIWEKN